VNLKCIEHSDKQRDSIKNSFIRINGRRISNGPIESTNNKIKTIIKNSKVLDIFTDLGIKYYIQLTKIYLLSIIKYR